MLARVGILLLSVALTGVWVARRVHTPETPSTEFPDPETPLTPSVRDVRVLIGADVVRMRVCAEGGIRISRREGSAEARTGRTTFSVCPEATGVRMDPEGECATAIKVEAVRGPTQVEFDDGRGWSDGATYPGSLRITPGKRGLDVVNAVDVERYTACVVAREIWPTFSPAAFRAQAIAARSFVLFQMQRRNGSDFDVTATQGSQVYRGVRDDDVGRRADRAAHETSGIVLTFHDGRRDQLFSTYYSAACGGRSQSAAIFGTRDDVPPLRGGVACDYCREAPNGTYRWGPAKFTLGQVRESLAGAMSELRSWGGIRELLVVERTSAGRPVTLRVISDEGESLDVSAERFRLLLDGMTVRSTDFDLRVESGRAIFDHGRGFGHGLGLCQWGMEGQAREGRRAGDILAYYYPGSKLTRVY
jgi:stage II sporulation protein D